MLLKWPYQMDHIYWLFTRYHKCDIVSGAFMDLNEEVKGLSFIEKLWTVVEKGELDLWEDRRKPPNLSVDEFEMVLSRVEIFDNISWVPRKSEEGRHGKVGEDSCFKFECEVYFGGVFEIETKRYFIKGYFFEKTKLKGVTIQSFREV